jgi:hypothetical protein
VIWADSIDEEAALAVQRFMRKIAHERIDPRLAYAVWD